MLAIQLAYVLEVFNQVIAIETLKDVQLPGVMQYLITIIYVSSRTH